MTVREFLDTHPDADLDLATPEGRIYLDAAGRRRLERGRPLIADNGSPKTAVYVQPDDLLEQIGCSAHQTHGLWRVAATKDYSVGRVARYWPTIKMRR